MHNPFWLKFVPQIMFDAENEGGGGAAEGGDQGAEGDEGGAALELYRPDGLDEAFHGESDHETIDKLMAGLKDARPSLPEDISGYEFQPDDGLKDYFGEDDPLLNAAKAAALNNGIAPDAFQKFINETFKDPVAQGMIAPPYDPKREMDNLATMIGGDAKAAEKAINDAEAVAANIAQTLALPESAAGFFEGMAETASGVMIIRAVQKMASEKGIPLGGSGAAASGQMTKEALEKLGADPRINPNSSKYDPELRKKYDDGFRSLYGE